MPIMVPGPAIRPPDKPPMFYCQHCNRKIHYVRDDKCPFCREDVSAQVKKYKDTHKESRDG